MKQDLVERSDTSTDAIVHLRLDDIEVPDVTAVFSYPVENDILTTSIRKYGLINPIIVVPGGKKHRLVCGVKRLHSAGELGWDTIPAIVLDEEGLTERELFDVAFADNVSVRNMNVIECAGIVWTATKILRITAGGDLDKYLSQLELPSGSQSIEIYQAVHGFEEEIKRYILKWNISAGQAYQLSMFETDDKRYLFGLIERLQLHGGKLKQFIDLLFEISRRDKSSIRSIMEDNNKQGSSILDNPRITITQKRAKVTDWLIAKRFPELNSRLKEFSEIAGSLEKVAAGVFSPPHNFEGDKIRASFGFKKLEELDTFCFAMQDETNRRKIRSLLNLL